MEQLCRILFGTFSSSWISTPRALVSPHKILYLESKSTETHIPTIRKTLSSWFVADRCPIQFWIWPVDDSKKNLLDIYVSIYYIVFDVYHHSSQLDYCRMYQNLSGTVIMYFIASFTTLIFFTKLLSVSWRFLTKQFLRIKSYLCVSLAGTTRTGVESSWFTHL